jgi:hypothetical protein
MGCKGRIIFYCIFTLISICICHAFFIYPYLSPSPSIYPSYLISYPLFCPPSYLIFLNAISSFSLYCKNLILAYYIPISCLSPCLSICYPLAEESVGSGCPISSSTIYFLSLISPYYALVIFYLC